MVPLYIEHTGKTGVTVGLTIPLRFQPTAEQQQQAEIVATNNFKVIAELLAVYLDNYIIVSTKLGPPAGLTGLKILIAALDVATHTLFEQLNIPPEEIARE
jgi:hypothetical protein